MFQVIFRKPLWRKKPSISIRQTRQGGTLQTLLFCSLKALDRGGDRRGEFNHFIIRISLG
uniref:Uncharacterized protein n=1 Tax=Picea glauca TaxID=3330 RepID=A0A101M3C9_PICGL|nr:hypothetical protein ABT39_MTgene172 [Picea glauca]